MTVLLGLTASDIALLVTAFGGGTTVQAAIAAIRARQHGARSREPAQVQALLSELERVRASEREAWDRADAMELRYDRMTSSRNGWREHSHRQHAWVIAHCRQPDDTYPTAPDERSGP